MTSSALRCFALCLLLVTLTGATLAEQLAPESAWEAYARHLQSDATEIRGASTLEAPEGGRAGFLAGAYRHGEHHFGAVVTVNGCDQGLCYGPSLLLNSLAPTAAPKLHPLVDLNGSGPVLGEATPASMGRAALPIEYEARRDGRTETRLVLWSLEETPVRVFDEAIASRADTGRRGEGRELRLASREGGLPDLLLDWKVWPGGRDHDAACLHDVVTRRFRWQGDRYREVNSGASGCR